MYAIMFRNRLLKSYHFNGFSGGMQEAFPFSKYECISFSSKKEAKEFIEEMKSDLKLWIEEDIPKQSKEWSEESRGEFLKENKKLYANMLKNVNRFKIVKLNIEETK